jgi:hypothetical protein
MLFEDTEENRNLLAAGADYVHIDSNPFPDRIGYHVHALALPWVKWRTIALERAVALERLHIGDTSLARVFRRNAKVEAGRNRTKGPESSRKLADIASTIM